MASIAAPVKNPAFLEIPVIAFIRQPLVVISSRAHRSAGSLLQPRTVHFMCQFVQVTVFAGPARLTGTGARQKL
jgi:hypothetical protein